MKTSHQVLLPLVALFAAACGGSGSAESAKPAETPGAAAPQIPGDSDIAAKAYDPGYLVPDSFFADLRSDTAGSYTIHHVLDSSQSYELCSNDLVEAQAWEEADNASRAVNGYYVTSIETDRYFEFVRELSYTQDVGNITTPTTPGFARVFKCGHTNRDGVDRNLLDGYAGRIDPALLTGARLRDFTEYLWQFRLPAAHTCARTRQQPGDRGLRSRRRGRMALRCECGYRRNLPPLRPPPQLRGDARRRRRTSLRLIRVHVRLPQ